MVQEGPFFLVQIMGDEVKWKSSPLLTVFFFFMCRDCFFKVFFILKHIKIIFFYFLKIIFNINILK